MNHATHETYPEITISGLTRSVENSLYGNLYNPEFPAMQPIIVLGSPGTAKTEFAVYELPKIWAKFLSDTTGTLVQADDIAVLVIHAGTRDPQEVSGPACPAPDSEGVMVFRFTKAPTIADMDEMGREIDGAWTPYKYFIIVTDEIASAREDQQLAMQRLYDTVPKLGDREVCTGDRVVMVFGTGNRMQDKAGSRRLLASISDRGEIYTMRFSFPDYKVWALAHDVNHVIIDFLEQHHEVVLADSVPKFDGPYGTARSMTYVAHKLDGYMRRPDIFDGTIPKWLETQFAALIGAKNARLLVDFIEAKAEVPLVADVFADPQTALLSNNFGYQSIAGHMVLNAVTKAWQLEQALLYIRRMRRDLQIVMGCKLQDILNRADFEDSVSSPVVQDFNDEFGEYFTMI